MFTILTVAYFLNTMPMNPSPTQCRAVAIQVSAQQVQANAAMHSCFEAYGALGCAQEFAASESWDNARVALRLRCK